MRQIFGCQLTHAWFLEFSYSIPKKIKKRRVNFPAHVHLKLHIAYNKCILVAHNARAKERSDHFVKRDTLMTISDATWWPKSSNVTAVKWKSINNCQFSSVSILNHTGHQKLSFSTKCWQLLFYLKILFYSMTTFSVIFFCKLRINLVLQNNFVNQ